MNNVFGIKEIVYRTRYKPNVLYIYIYIIIIWRLYNDVLHNRQKK